MDQFFVLGCFHEFVPSEILSEKWMLIFVIVQIFTMLNTIFTNIFYNLSKQEWHTKNVSLCIVMKLIKQI